MDCKCYLLPQCCLKQQGKDQCINIFMKESNNRPFGEDFWVGARGTVGNDGGKEHMGCSRKEVQIIFFFCGSCLVFLASHSLFPLPWSLRELSEKSFDFWLTPWILIRRNSLKYPHKKHDNNSKCYNDNILHNFSSLLPINYIPSAECCKMLASHLDVRKL